MEKANDQVLDILMSAHWIPKQYDFSHVCRVFEPRSIQEPLGALILRHLALDRSLAPHNKPRRHVGVPG